VTRKKTFNVFREAAKAAPGEALPMLPETIDTQVELSRNAGAQPWWMLFDKDTLLAQASGRGTVSFALGPLRWHAVKPGDFVYVPAGMPHRYQPDSESVQLRYRPMARSLEGAAWFCACGTELYREEWESGEALSLQSCRAAAGRFNADAASRRCPSCGATHPVVDLE
jgi:hypothetical protein